MVQTGSKVEGRFYPHPDRRWGACADELFFYTSRYYGYTEAFLRNLSGWRRFHMAGYQARRLNEPQREAMALVLAVPPDQQTGRDAVWLVQDVIANRSELHPQLQERNQLRLQSLPPVEGPHPQQQAHLHSLPQRLPPLDPFLTLAERLHIPVAVLGHHVDLPFDLLAQHLDSPQAQVRENLLDAVLWLHEAGYRLRNHPSLTFAEIGQLETS